MSWMAEHASRLIVVGSAALLVIVLISPMHGCSLAITSQDLPATNLAAVQRGAAREVVERELGKPVFVQSSKFGEIRGYRYHMGYSGSAPDLTGMNPYGAIYAILLQPILIPIAMNEVSEKVEKSTRQMFIVFDESDSVAAVYVDYDMHGDEFLELMTRADNDQETAQIELRRMLQSGDREVASAVRGQRTGLASAYQLAHWSRLCRAAMNGNGQSQYEIAWYYQLGKAPAVQDPVKALMWFEIAANAGHEDASKTYRRFSGQMLETQVSRSREMVRTWKPDEAHCEG